MWLLERTSVKTVRQDRSASQFFFKGQQYKPHIIVRQDRSKSHLIVRQIAVIVLSQWSLDKWVTVQSCRNCQHSSNSRSNPVAFIHMDRVKIPQHDNKHSVKSNKIMTKDYAELTSNIAAVPVVRGYPQLIIRDHIVEDLMSRVWCPGSDVQDLMSSPGSDV